jgi:3-oxoadipate enol-lactonase
MPEAPVNDITIHYERTGAGAPVLLLHGLGSSSEDWENQVPALAESFDVITPDLRGHGSSSKPMGHYSIEMISNDIVGLLDKLDLGKVVIVGISLGGMVGFQIAADRPDLVERLVIVNALQAFETTRFSQKVQVAIRKVITKRLSMDKIGEVLSKRLFPEDGMEDQRAKMVERWARNDKAAYQATFQAILDWDGVAGAMKATEIPITVISSDQDYIMPEDKVPYIEAMPTAEMVIFDDAHHAAPMERPDRFNALLLELLS